MQGTKERLVGRLQRLLVLVMTVLVVGLAWGRNDMALAVPDELNVSQELTGDDATIEANNSAQTFQLTKSGSISRISLWTYSATAGNNVNATVQLRQGIPGAGGALLGTATLAFNSTTPTWRDFVFATPVPVTGSTTYHYLLTYTGTTGVIRLGYKITAPGASPYAGGDHYTPNGASWDMWNDADTAFRVYLALNQAPALATNSALSLNEGATATVANTNLNATDPDGDTVTYTVGTPTANGTLKKGASILLAGGTFTQADINAGQITYLHSGSDTTTDSFTFTAADGKGGTINSTTFTINVTPVNDAPTFTIGSNVTVLEDAGAYSAANFVTGRSAVEAGQTLTTTVTNNNNALFAAQPTVDGSGTLTFTPAANANGTATVTVTVQDNGGTANGGNDTTAKIFTVTVTPVNDAPSFTIGANQTVNEDAGAQTAAGLATGISAGPNEGAQTVSFLVTNNNNGLFSVQPAVATNGQLTYTPAPDANGVATVTVRAQDNGGTANGGSDTSAPQTFTITVTAVNDAPVGAADTLPAVLEDSGQITIPFATLTGNDSKGPSNESGQTLTITNVTAGAGSTVSIAGGNVLFQPTANFYGTATFTYTVQDSGPAPNTGTATVNVPVTAVADTPSVTAGTTLEDTQTTSGLVITRNAVDGAEVTHFKITGITNGKLYKTDGTTEITNGSYITAVEGAAGLKFTPAANLNSSGSSFAFSVAAALDGAGTGLSGSASATIVVTPTNDAPTGANDTLSTVAEDSGPWTIPFASLTANDSKGPADESGQTLTVSAVSSPVGGTVAISGTDVIFTPTLNFNGTASFTYTVQDNGAAPNTGTATASFTVTAVNDAPVGADDTLSAVDEDSAPRTIPFASLLGNDSPGPTDESGQTLTISAVSSPTGGTVAISGTDVIFTLTPNYQGTAGFTYTVADNGTTNGLPDPLTNTANVTFTVNGVAEAPNVTAATTAEDTKSTSGLVITPNAADGPAVTHFQIAGITGGLLYKSDGTTQIVNGDYLTAAEGAAGLTFMPGANLNTPAGDTFEFTVRAALDAAGTGMSPGTVATITVNEVNDAPAGTDDNPGGALTEDYGSLTFNGADLLANDGKGPANESGQTLSITAVDNVVGGTASVVGGNVLFTTAADYYGTASFRYTLSDNGTTNGAANPLTSTATVTFTITPVPDAPQITGATTAEDTQSTTGLVVTPNALDGAEISHFQVTAITGGRLFKQSGTELFVNDLITAAEGASGLKFTPAADANGTGFSIALAAHDSGRSLTGPATTAAITVTEVNDAPTGVNDTLTAVAEDSAPLTIAAADLTGNDLKGPTDESGQTLTITSVSALLGGSVTLDVGTQTITFTPAADFHGTATFTYTLQDNGTTGGAADPQTATATVSIPVNPVADTPSVTPATTAEETQSTSGLVITRSGVDGAEVTHFQITGITGGKLYQTNGTTEITNGTIITAAEAGAGLKFTPATEKNTPAGDTFTFTVRAALDGSGASLSGPVTATITVTEVNDAPTGANDSLTDVAEDSGPWTISFATLTANDSAGPTNEAGQALTVLNVSNGLGGTVAISGTDVIFTPTPNFNGAASFTYTVQDTGTTNGVANTQSAAAPTTVTFTVTPVNDAPVGADDTLSAVAEDSAPRTIPFASLLGNDSTGPADESGQTLTVSAVSSPTGGTVAISGTDVIFTLTPNFNGTASFTYTVQDNGTPALTHTAQVTFLVNPSAEVPTISPATTAEETKSTSGLVITPDAADGGGVTHFQITAITGGSLYQNDGTTLITNGTFITAAQGAAGLRFMPGANLNTLAGDTFAFTVQAALDGIGTGISPTITTTITVNEVNDAPTGVDDDLTGVVGYTLAEDSAAKTFLAADLLINDSKGPSNESGQTLSITAADNAVGGTVAVVSGNVVFTPAANFAGPASFRYTLSDNGTTSGAADFKTATATVSFNVTPMPDAPQITPATTAEDTRSSAGLVITRNALDGAEITHFKITGITGGTLFQNDGTTAITNGTFITTAQGNAGLKFTPNADLNTLAGNAFGFTAQAALDGTGTGLSLGAPVTITVNEVNDDPTGVNETLSAVLEDSTTRTIPFAGLLINDSKGPSNESGQSLTITAVTALTGGTVTISGTDVLFTPAANFYGTATFSYTLQDTGTTAGLADPKTSTATVSIPVTAVADTPVVTATTTAEDTQSTTGLVISRNAVDGAEVTHFQITGITGGKLYQNNGTTEITNGTFITAAEGGAGLKFTPAADKNTPAGDAFGFTVKAALDGSGTGISASGSAASITVTAVNDTPTGVNDSLTTVAEDSGPWTIPFATLTGNDNPGPNEGAQTLTVSAVSGAVGGTVAISGTDVIFTPTPDFNGTASFTYTVQDNGTTNGNPDAKTATATASFTVTTVNDAPVGADDTLSTVAEDSPARTIPFAALLGNDSKGPTDESGQTLTITAVSSSIGGTATISGSNVIFTLTPNFHGTAGFSYTVADNGTTNGTADGKTDAADVTFPVTPVADTPTATTTTTPEDVQSTAGLVLSRNAVDGAEVTHFKITGVTGGQLYQNDGTTAIADGSFITVAEGGAGLKFSPNANLNSSASTFSFTVQAAQGATDTAISGATTVAITVTAVNDGPTGVADALPDVTEDSSTLTILGSALIANDSKGPANESGQILTVTAADTAVGGTVSVAGGNVLFTPAANFYGTASFRYTLTDDGTTNDSADPKSSTATVTFQITPTPDQPQITAATTAEDTQTTAGLVVTRHSDDGTEITHFQVTGITGGRLYQNDGTTEILVNDLITAVEGAAGLKFTPNVDANGLNGGSFSVTMKAHDSLRTLTGPASTATITVTEVNDAPWGSDDTLADKVEDDPAFRIPFATLLANDVVGPNESVQSLTIAGVSGAVGGTVAIDGTDLVFTPAADFTGPASFTYTLQDNGTTNGAPDRKTATAVTRFTITEVNDAPTGVADTLVTVAEDAGPWTIPFTTLTDNDSTGPVNESTQHLTVTAVADPVGGTVSIVGTDVIFTPTLNFNGAASFTYTLQDDGTTHNTSDPKTATAVVPVTFTVTPVNDAPVAADQALLVTVGHLYTGTVSATDVEADTLTYTLVAAPTKGTVTMNGTGSFSYTGTALGTDTFTFKANDSTADSNVATVTITVNAEPLVPVLTISVPVTETRESSIVASGKANPFFYVVVNGTTVQADALGNWSRTVALVEGPNTITAAAAGLTKSVVVTRDTRPPQVELTASATRTEEETVVLTAVSEPGALIEIEGQPVSTLTVTLKMGNNRFTATATDKAGNKSTDTVTVLRVGNVPKPVEIKPGEAGEATTQYFRVSLPGEAVTEPLLLQVVAPSLDSAAIRQAEGAARSVMTGDAVAEGQTTGSELHVLAAPATITFIYDPAQVPNPRALRIYYFDPNAKVWVEVGGTVNLTDHSITVQVEHFTTFAAMEPQQDAPVLNAPPALVKTESLTVTGTSKPGTPVTLVVNRIPQTTVMTDATGHFTLQGTLTAGRNWLYVKGTGTLASREMTVTYQTGSYTDIGGHWAEPGILRLEKLGVVSLYPVPLFQPEARVTRLEFAVMVSRVLRLAPVSEKPTFTDTAAMPAWALPEISAAVKAGIILGMPDGSFAPDALVTRAQMAIMLTRALNYAGKEIAYGDKDFTDGAQIPEWALQQVLVAARYGLITGYPDGSFQAGNSTTRAEAVTMLNRLLDVVAK